MADYFSNRGSTVWVQPGGPNTIMYPLLCHDLDTIDEPLGDVTLRLCRNPDGTYSVANRDQGSPDNLRLYESGSSSIPKSSPASSRAICSQKAR